MRAFNLIPVESRRGGGSSGGSGVYLLLGGLGALVLAVAAFVFVSNSVTSRKAELAALTVETTRTEAQAAALKPYLDFANLRQKRVSTIQALARNRFPWERTMRQIARVVPSNVWLTQFVGTVAPGITVEEVTGGDSSMLRSAVQAPAVQLIGCTYEHSEVSRLMSRLRRMTGVTRVSLATSEKPKDDAVNVSGPGQLVDDCRFSYRIPRFHIVVFFEPLPGAPAAAAPGAPASPGAAGQGAGQPASNPAGGAK